MSDPHTKTVRLEVDLTGEPRELRRTLTYLADHLDGFANGLCSKESPEVVKQLQVAIYKLVEPMTDD
jgi:hypothetical protein